MVGIAFIEKMLSLDEAGDYFIRTCGEELELDLIRFQLR